VISEFERCATDERSPGYKNGMFLLFLLFACEPRDACVVVEASVADSNMGHCDPCLLEEVSLDSCGWNDCARPLRTQRTDDGCFGEYTVYDEAGEVVGSPTCHHDFGRQILDGNTCERVPWTPPAEGFYELEVVHMVDGERLGKASYSFEVRAEVTE